MGLSKTGKNEAVKKKVNKTDLKPENKIEKAVETATVLPIVAIGASAGGLAAFECFFSGFSNFPDPGMAFIIVQHLAPDHKSILSDLIRRYTRMQVFEVEDGMEVKANCVYIIPPNHDMALLNGSLQLLKSSSKHGPRLPVDFLFRSIAQDQQEKAICIVLSGAGSDGTLGVKAVKEAGGMAMAQIPSSTEYDSMPRSAIATGLIDYQLSPSEMPAQLLTYVAHAFGRTPQLITIANQPKTQNALKKIFVLLRAQTMHDFSQYKPNTINRRIERRMAVQQIETLEDYIKFLQQTPAEVDALFHDLLIGVTNFFRDPDAFEMIEKLVIPRIFAERSGDQLIRVWSCGCSTGEEAYSLAMLLAEHQEKIRSNFKIQVFATDIDNQGIATARAGIYPASIAADISPERLAHFFSPIHVNKNAEPNSYRIHQKIRDMLIFSEHDLIKDPPFSKIDLITCRNLLIYLGGELQKKLIPLFHYSLNSSGFLFLGSSESIGDFTDLFTMSDRKAKLFQRREIAMRRSLGTFLPTTALEEGFTQTARKISSPIKNSLREIAEQSLLQQTVPAALLVASNGDILYLHGRAGTFLELVPGEAGVNNVIKMARQGLRYDLTTALHKASATHEVQSCPGLQVKTNGDFTTVNLTVRPVPTDPGGGFESYLYLVILEQGKTVECSHIPTPVDTKKSSDTETDKRISALQKELRAKEEYLQTTNEELQTSNEELKSSNEEMQSVNEELQSTNEELETSKEELQSLNEELATVNSELQNKVSDLSRANNDMNNLLAGTNIGTVFVDHQQRILRFTPAITRVINLIQGDIGRPVGNIAFNLDGYETLLADVQEVLDTLIPKEIEVKTKAGIWYALRILPYRTVDNVIEGAVLTFVDISIAKKAVETLRLNQFAVDCSLDAIAWINAQGKCIYANNAQCQMLGYSREELLNMTVFDIEPTLSREVFNTHWQKLRQEKSLAGEITLRERSGKSLAVASTFCYLEFEGKAVVCSYARIISDAKGL